MDNPKKWLKYLGCLLSAALCIGLLAWLIHNTLPILQLVREFMPEEKEPLVMLSLILGGLLAVAGGIVFAVVQRIRELRKGEEDEAKKY